MAYILRAAEGAMDYHATVLLYSLSEITPRSVSAETQNKSIPGFTLPIVIIRNVSVEHLQCNVSTWSSEKKHFVCFVHIQPGTLVE